MGHEAEFIPAAGPEMEPVEARGQDPEVISEVLKVLRRKEEALPVDPPPVIELMGEPLGYEPEVLRSAIQDAQRKAQEG